jgi:hypothetical protein
MKTDKQKNKQQDDRFLKRLALRDRRRQEQLRQQINQDQIFKFA